MKTLHWRPLSAGRLGFDAGRNYLEGGGGLKPHIVKRLKTRLRRAARYAAKRTAGGGTCS